MQDRVTDIETTLEINKGLINTLIANQSSDHLQEVYKKIQDENTFLKKRLQQTYQDNEIQNSKLLLQEQIIADFKMKEHHITT